MPGAKFTPGAGILGDVILDLTEKTLSSEKVFSGRVLTLYRDKVSLPGGGTSTREVARHHGAVCILPVSDDGDVYLVDQYRYAVGRVMTEAPAGKLEGDEDPFDCAVRELKEETGVTAANIIPLGKMTVSPGYCDEVIYLYTAQGLSFGEQSPDEDEFLQLRRLPLAKAYSMVLGGEITDAKTQLIILKACAALGLLKQPDVPQL